MQDRLAPIPVLVNRRLREIDRSRPERKHEAEALCAALNARLGWRGSDPEYPYDGRVVLSARAA